MKQALIFQGGWAGHAPAAFADLLASRLREHGIESRIEPTLACLEDAGSLRKLALIVPCWTMGAISRAQSDGLQAAVKSGVGLGGIHGGMGDAFRGNLDYEWMVGGHFVGHPHVGEYQVRVADAASALTRGLPPVFNYRSEQYYLMMDPGVHVLADTLYAYEGRHVTMPVAWTKTWGEGRVFYASPGHVPDELQIPEAERLVKQGLAWAARS